jgi:hypothetical protein
MKSIPSQLLVLLCLSALPACAQIKYSAKITVRVVDDAGSPVTSGVVQVSTFARWVPGEGFGHDEHDQYEAKLTDEGIAVVEMRCLRNEISYGSQLNDHYYSGGGGLFRFKEVINGRWEPWNPQLEIVVPRILKPIPMYGRRVGESPRLEMPSTEPVGYDLAVSDWVAPHGKGKRSDLIFTHHAKLRAADVNSPFESFFSITFSNPADGIQSRLAKPGRRLLELPRVAPEDGYESELVRHVSWAGIGTSMQTGTLEEQNYYIRVRTVVDSNGKVVSALYGKIYGDIQFFAPPGSNGMARFTYYLNPTPLDRNLEFDPKRNLLSDRLSGTIGLEP